MSSRPIGRIRDAGTEPPAPPPSVVLRSAAERLQALGEATCVRLLGLGQGLEPLGDLVEAFFPRRLREARVHLGELVGLTRDGRLEVLVGRADRLTRGRVADFLQEVHVPEGVSGLGLRGVAKETAYIGVA